MGIQINKQIKLSNCYRHSQIISAPQVVSNCSPFYFSLSRQLRGSTPGTMLCLPNKETDSYKCCYIFNDNRCYIISQRVPFFFFFFLCRLMAVDKPTYGVLPPPTGLECEASTGNKTKQTNKKTINKLNSTFQSCYFEIIDYFSLYS